VGGNAKKKPNPIELAGAGSDESANPSPEFMPKHEGLQAYAAQWKGVWAPWCRFGKCVMDDEARGQNIEGSVSVDREVVGVLRRICAGTIETHVLRDERSRGWSGRFNLVDRQRQHKRGGHSWLFS